MDKIVQFFQNFQSKKKFVHLLQIRGTINAEMTQKIYKALKKFKGDRSECIALIINSEGGSPSQAYLIMRRLQQIQQKYNIPIYTFAEDYALSAGFLLHQIGDKRFCDETSLIGGAGTRIHQVKVKELVEKLGVEVNFFTTSDKPNLQQIMDPLVSSGDNSKILTELNNQAQEKFKQIFENLNKDRKIKLTSEERNEFQGGKIFLGRKMIEAGFCHGSDTYHDFLRREHKDVQWLELTRKTRNEQAQEFISKIKLQALYQTMSGSLKFIDSKIN